MRNSIEQLVLNEPPELSRSDLEDTADAEESDSSEDSIPLAKRKDANRIKRKSFL